VVFIAASLSACSNSGESESGAAADGIGSIEALDLQSLAVPGTPPPRTGGDIVYVPRYDAAVLHGGVDYQGELVGDTWVFDVRTSSWWQLEGGPPSSAFPSLVYDSERDLVIAVVGFGEDGGSTWTLDITDGSWSRLAARVERIVGDLATFHPELGTVALVEENLWRLNVIDDRWDLVNGGQLSGFDQFRDGRPEASGFLVCERDSGVLQVWGAPAISTQVDPSTVWHWALDGSWQSQTASAERSRYEGAAGDLVPDERTLVTLSLDYVQDSEGLVTRTPALWRFDLTSAEWSKIPQTGEPPVTQKPGIAYIPTVKRLLVIGDFRDEMGQELATAWFVDPKSGVWEALPASN
jgi:hypothetical protein